MRRQEQSGPLLHGDYVPKIAAQEVPTLHSVVVAGDEAVVQTKRISHQLSHELSENLGSALSQEIIQSLTESHGGATPEQHTLTSNADSTCRDAAYNFPEQTATDESEDTQRHNSLVDHVPAAHVPAAHVPAAHVPAAHVPAAYVPAAHVPAAHVPAAHVPTAHDPTTHIPTTHIPAIHFPATHFPANHFPANPAQPSSTATLTDFIDADETLELMIDDIVDRHIIAMRRDIRRLLERAIEQRSVKADDQSTTKRANDPDSNGDFSDMDP